MCIPCVMCGACFDADRDERPLSCPECEAPLPPSALCCPACHTFVGHPQPSPPDAKADRADVNGSALPHR